MKKGNREQGTRKVGEKDRRKKVVMEEEGMSIWCSWGDGHRSSFLSVIRGSQQLPFRSDMKLSQNPKVKGVFDKA